ncbi:IS3 family transposase [Streptomyces mutabilis]|uniref:Transposase n=1 Tax=Streptomyces mutabilis TaxID=67332 RepID=A0A086MS47_9ACTN|nr:IS3 family transposase [Streptomyces mutabilis]KFG71715.1 transposase [Streptomyces mutabilis]
MNDVYAFIEAERTTHPVALLCRMLKVSRSSFYAWMAGEQARAARRATDDALAHEITVLHIASRCTYGVPRIHAELRRLEWRVNRKRVERVMRERGIAGVTRRKRRSLTRPAKKSVPAHDLIGRDFTADAPGRKLVGDITYIPTDEGWLYLATWLDLATRSHQFAGLASQFGVRLSVGRTGQCWDNALAESFFSTIKRELLGTSAWPSRAAARTAIFDFIEGWYNLHRLHSSLGYLSPAEYETALAA